jgi:hypothetical protein
MITEQLIWFIDSRFYYQTSSLDKIVRLANIHQKSIKVLSMQVPKLQAVAIGIYLIIKKPCRKS